MPETPEPGPGGADVLVRPGCATLVRRERVDPPRLHVADGGEDRGEVVGGHELAERGRRRTGCVVIRGGGRGRRRCRRVGWRVGSGGLRARRDGRLVGDGVERPAGRHDDRQARRDQHGRRGRASWVPSWCRVSPHRRVRQDPTLLPSGASVPCVGGRFHARAGRLYGSSGDPGRPVSSSDRRGAGDRHRRHEVRRGDRRREGRVARPGAGRSRARRRSRIALHVAGEHGGRSHCAGRGEQQHADPRRRRGVGGGRRSGTSSRSRRSTSRPGTGSRCAAGCPTSPSSPSSATSTPRPSRWPKDGEVRHRATRTSSP